MPIVKFIPGKSHQWKNYNINNFDIWIASDSSHSIAENFAKQLINTKVINEVSVSNLLNKINDHFGIIVISKNWFFAAVDVCRSYPIYWYKDKKKILLSNQAKIISDVTKSKINSNQRLAFQMSGYTIGKNTLWFDIYNLNGGDFLLFQDNNEAHKYKYFYYKPWIIKKIAHTKLKKMLKSEINKVLNNLILKADGRTIVVPLSAGLDSRLIASGLKHVGYKKVKCFSYGLRNNFESQASKKISKILGFEWKFVEINYMNSREYFQSNEYKNIFKACNDGCATPGMQDAYAIKKLIESKFLSKNDLIVNGNSGDFISGGHLPINSNKWYKQSNQKHIIDIIFNDHYIKHYSLWGSLLNKNNKKIIKEEIKKHILTFKTLDDKEILPQGIIELLEYENRQSKYVINFQRIYDFYQLSWALPLWDKSFIEFWSKVSPENKLKQKLYKEVLSDLNMGNVWSKNFEFRKKISPLWARIIRFFFKVAFIFIGKSSWHNFDKKFISYWTDNISGQCLLPYHQVIKNNNQPRHFVSWHTLNSEQESLKSNWQNIDFDK
jgi:asparagine synthase (glutamine-hydrolysing)